MGFDLSSDKLKILARKKVSNSGFMRMICWEKNF